MPTARTTQRSHGTKSAMRPSRKNASTVVSATAAEAKKDATSEVRCSHSSQAPMPTSAAIAGARATV